MQIKQRKSFSLRREAKRGEKVRELIKNVFCSTRTLLGCVDVKNNLIFLAQHQGDVFVERAFIDFHPGIPFFTASCFYLVKILTFIRCFLTFNYLSSANKFSFFSAIYNRKFNIKGKFPQCEISFASFLIALQAVRSEIKFNLCKVNRREYFFGKFEKILRKIQFTFIFA